jgi:hypothetical protein
MIAFISHVKLNGKEQLSAIVWLNHGMSCGWRGKCESMERVMNYELLDAPYILRPMLSHAVSESNRISDHRNIFISD